MVAGRLLQRLLLELWVAGCAAQFPAPPVAGTARGAGAGGAEEREGVPVAPPAAGTCGMGEDHHDDGWGHVSIACPVGQTVGEVLFASWGDWTADCGSYKCAVGTNSCNGAGCNAPRARRRAPKFGGDDSVSQSAK